MAEKDKSKNTTAASASKNIVSDNTKPFKEVIDELKEQGELTRNKDKSSLQVVIEHSDELNGSTKSLHNMMKGSLDGIETVVSKPLSKTAAEKEKTDDENNKHNKLMKLLSKIGGGFAKAGGKAKDGIGSAFSSIMSFIRRFKSLFIAGGLLALMPVLEEFFNSIAVLLLKSCKEPYLIGLNKIMLHPVYTKFSIRSINRKSDLCWRHFVIRHSVV